MATNTKGGSAKRSDSVTRVSEGQSTSGREVWRIASGGQTWTVAASGASTTLMDSAMQKYREALRRLADR